MKGTLFFCSIVALASAKPGGYYHQEYNYKSSSSSFKNNELQHQNEDQGSYSKDGDLEGRTKPKVNSHNQHSEYTNPRLLSGSSVNLGVNGYHGANGNQANLDGLVGSNMNGYRTGGAVDGYASADRVMDLSNMYTSGSHGSSHGNYRTSLGYDANSGGYRTNTGDYGTNSGGYGTDSSGYRTNSGGYGTSSSDYRTSSGGLAANSDGYGTKIGYGSNLGGYGRTRENYGTSHGTNVGNSLESASNFGSTQGGSRYGYVQHGSSSGISGYRGTNANLNSMVQRLQEEMSRQLQHAVNNQYRSSGYATSVSSSQMTADIRNLEEELKRNMTRQLEESLRSQYGQQELRGADSYSVVEGRPSNVVNYRSQELADLTGQLENNLLKNLHQNIRTTYNRESGSTHSSSNNMYQPTYISSSTYRPSHYERHVMVVPNSVRYTPVSNPDSITRIASKIQSDINVYLDNALQNIYSTYLQSGRSTYTLNDFDNEVNRIRDQIIRNLTWNLDDQIRRNYGQQILKDDHYYSVSSTGETSSQHNYNRNDYDSLRKQVEENLLKKLSQTVNTYRDQYQRQQSYSTNTNYYTATFKPVYYTSGNQVYDYSDLQRQLSEQLQNALNKHRYSHSSSYSMSTSNNPQGYQISLDELTRELQRNLTEQLNNYRGQSSSSSYGYTSGGSATAGSTDFESMKNQLQNQLMQQLQQGLQKQYRYSASASYSASSSSSSNGNYGTHQSYGNFANLHPNRYKRDVSFYGPRRHHYSFQSTKSSKAYSSIGKYSSQEHGGINNFSPNHNHDLHPLEFDHSMNFDRRTGNHFRSTHSERSGGDDENSSEVVEDVPTHHQVERPQKLYFPAGHQVEIGRPKHMCRHHSGSSQHHRKFHEEKFINQELTRQQEEDDLNKHSGTSGHYGLSRYHANNKFEVSGHMIPQHSQFPEQGTGDYSIDNPGVEQPQQTAQSEEYFTQHLQTGNPHKQFKYTPNDQLPEPQSQENFDRDLRFKDPQRPKKSIFYQHTENHLQDLHDLSQQLEQEAQLEQQAQPEQQAQLEQQTQLEQQAQLEQQTQLEQEAQLEQQNQLVQNSQLEQEAQFEQEVPRHRPISVQQQQTENLTAQKLESSHGQHTQTLDQHQIEDQDEPSQDIEISHSQKPINSLQGYGQEQQQVEEESFPKLSLGKPSGRLEDELPRHLDQDQEDLTQQLEENLHVPKYPQKIEEQHIDDLQTQQVQLSHNKKSQELEQSPVDQQVEDQDDLTQQQIQDDLTHQIQLTGRQYPKKLGNGQAQELDQSQSDLENLVGSKKLNRQSEQELEDQNDLTQQLELEAKPKPAHLSENDFTQQLEIERKQGLPEQNHISEQQFEDQDNPEPNLLRTYPKNKPRDGQSQEQQSEEDMTQQLVLSSKPKPNYSQDQEQASNREHDMNQQLELDQTLNTSTPDQQITKQVIQESGNTQELESHLTLEPNNRKLEQEHQDQLVNDLNQQLESTDFQKLKKSITSYGQELENDSEQKQESINSQVAENVNQQVQEQERIPGEQPVGQQIESDQSQQLELDNIQKKKKPYDFSEPDQQLENEQDGQLELTSEQKPLQTEDSAEQQPQLQLTDTDQSEYNRNQPNEEPLPEADTSDFDNKLELTDANIKDKVTQKSLTEQTTEVNIQRVVSDVLHSHNLRPHGHFGDDFQPPEERTSSNKKVSTHTHIGPITNPATVTHQESESNGHSSSSERAFTNSHSGHATNRVTTGDNYEEAMRQQDALIDLLKQKIHTQPTSQSTYGQRTIKKNTYVNGNLVGTARQTHFINHQGEIIGNEPTSPPNVNTFSNSKIFEHTGNSGRNYQDNSGKTAGYGGNEIRRTTFHVDANVLSEPSENMNWSPYRRTPVGNSLNADFSSHQSGHDARGNEMQGRQFSAKTTRRVVQFVNGKPFSAIEYVRIVKPNGQIVESKRDIPLTEDLLRQDLSQGIPANHLEDTSRIFNHVVHIEGSTKHLPNIENLLRQHQFQELPSDFSLNMADGTRIKGSLGRVVKMTQDTPLILPPSQFDQNMENHFQVDGSRRTNHFDPYIGSQEGIPSTEDLLSQRHFSHHLTTGQFPGNIDDYSRVSDLSSTSDHFRQNVNAFDDAFGSSGFTGQARKKSSYYVNGKLVSSSESNQYIRPDGKVIEINEGSSPSAIGSIEQIAEQQSGHKSVNTSRYGVKTSRYTSRIGY